MSDNSLKHAPKYTQHRAGVSAVDSLPETEKGRGMNTDGYLAAHVQVVPSGGANPSVKVQVWSDALGQFIDVTETEFAQTGAGADVPYEFTIPVRSRAVFVAVTALAAGTCDIYMAGSELDHLR